MNKQPDNEHSKPLRNPRHEAFAQDVASGMSQSDAYRKNFNIVTASRKTVDEAASKLASKVNPRVETLQKQLADRCLFSKQEAVKTLRDIALDDKKEIPANARVSAIAQASKMLGWNAPAKVDVGEGVSFNIDLGTRRPQERNPKQSQTNGSDCLR